MGDTVSGTSLRWIEDALLPSPSLHFIPLGAITVRNHGVEVVMKTAINGKCNCSHFPSLAAIRRSTWSKIVGDRGQQEAGKEEARRLMHGA